MHAGQQFTEFTTIATLTIGLLVWSPAIRRRVTPVSYHHASRRALWSIVAQVAEIVAVSSIQCFCRLIVTVASGTTV